MFREFFISFIGHMVFIVSLIGAIFFFGKPEIQRFEVYRVKTVSPQLIANLLKITDTVDKPNRKVIQIETPQKPLPEKNMKKSPEGGLLSCKKSELKMINRKKTMNGYDLLRMLRNDI